MPRLTRPPPLVGRLEPRIRRSYSEGKQDIQQRRVDAPWLRWYSTARWRRLRLAVFLRDGYTCQRPGCGRLESNSSKLVADHKRAHRGNADLFWDEGNVVTWCKSCHDQEKQREEQASLHMRGVWD